MLSDATTVLGALVGGAGTTTIGCLGGAQIDRNGNINSTMVPGGAFLVGSGGGNDVASVAAECIVVATLNPTRTPPECGYITSPGRGVRALVTDLGLLEKIGDDDELVLTAVPEGPEPIAERIERARAACGWELRGRRRTWRASQPAMPTRWRRSAGGIPAAGSSAPADGTAEPPGTLPALACVRPPRTPEIRVLGQGEAPWPHELAGRCRSRS